MIKREVKLETMLARLIERDGYNRNRQPILDSINVTAAALSQYVRGRTRPSFDKLLALADFFGVSLDYLVYGEPTSTPADPAPLARYIQQALSDERARTTRLADLITRIGGQLMARVNEVASDLETRLSGVEGLIELDDILRVEQHCVQADIVTADLEADIIFLEDDTAAPGPFFSVVVDNLSRGCTYRFLLVGEAATQPRTVLRFQEMISDAIGGDKLYEYCFFRAATSPVTGVPVLYNLDISTLVATEPAIFSLVSKHLDDQTWLGYLNRPNDDSDVAELMSASHVKTTRDAFAFLWNEANHLGPSC